MQEILLNIESKEIRYAYLKHGKLEDVIVERKKSRQITGNIYRGKVTNILHNIQSAFIDINEEENGFIHISDILENTRKFEEMFDMDFDLDQRPEKKQSSGTTSGDINKILKPNQPVLVQVVKEPIGTKGARLTSNISIAGEMKQQTATEHIPRAMLWAVVIVALTYVLPFAAMWVTGLPASAWETGAWADIAQLMGGPVLRIALVAGGMLSGFGMFNALVMSYSRLPLAMAQDGMLPKVFAKLHPKSRAPWVAILALAVGWGLALNLGFERLVTLDIMIYGASLTLEFVALIVLRFREPELKRPFRVPGGWFGAIAVGISPTLLLGFAVLNSSMRRSWG